MEELSKFHVLMVVGVEVFGAGVQSEICALERRTAVFRQASQELYTSLRVNKHTKLSIHPIQTTSISKLSLD